ncbi:hypothetical protein CI102_8785 [Trichoderma harzianum]|nr:hypothetical protein CI102_8785 [Trichoderma harzianum]
MPDRTRISTRTWAGILVTHGVYYENSCYPVVLGLEGSVKTWPRNAAVRNRGARQLSDDIRSSTPIGAHYSLFNLSSSASRTPHALRQANHRLSRSIRAHGIEVSHLCHELADARTQCICANTRTHPSLLDRQLASTHPDADTRSSPVQLVQGRLQTGP